LTRYVDCKRQEEPVTGEDGLRVMQIIEAAIQSSAQKKAIDL
jgi:predicted dehydrogenase